MVGVSVRLNDLLLHQCKSAYAQPARVSTSKGLIVLLQARIKVESIVKSSQVKVSQQVLCSDA